MTTPRIRVRLIYVSRDTRALDWLDEAQEVHSIGLELIDASTRDGGKGTIYFYSVDPAVCSFIAGTKIGEEFDVALMPVEKQTDLAETLLEWIRLNREQMEEMSSEGVMSTLATFMTDTENLCNEYLKDVQP